MRNNLSAWVRLLVSGGLLFGAVGSGCLSDTLLDLSDDLSELAGDINGQDEHDTDFGEFLDDLADLF